MATVLVTGVGGAGGIGAVRTLAERPAYEVVGVDMEPRSAGFYLADAGRVVPAAAADDWADAVRSVVAEFDVDAVIPTVDEELARLPALYGALPEDVAVVVPRREVVDVALDKYRTAERLADAGHAVPATWLASDLPDPDTLPTDLLVKPRRGRGSRGIERVEGPAELRAAIDAADDAPSSLLVQEFVTGTEFTTSVVTTRDDRLLGVVPKEAIEKRGSTVTGVTRRAPDVAADCRALVDTLAPRGPMNVQQIVDPDGVVHTIEINPRFSSTSCLTAAAGIHEFDLLVRDALGEDVSHPGSFESDLYLQRYQNHTFVPAATFESVPERGR